MDSPRSATYLLIEHDIKEYSILTWAELLPLSEPKKQKAKDRARQKDNIKIYKLLDWTNKQDDYNALIIKFNLQNYKMTNSNKLVKLESREVIM